MKRKLFNSHKASHSFHVSRHKEELSQFGRFETKEDIAPESKMNLNKRIEPKEYGDTDEPETPNSEFVESPRIQGIQINV